MIKAEDLRIGDLVIVNDNCSLEQGTIGKVSEIRSTPLYKENEGSIGLKPISNDRWPWGVLCSNIDPIPLTPEILEKNGWDKETYHDRFLNKIKERYCFTLSNTGLSIEYIPYRTQESERFVIYGDCFMIKYIVFVHELQHILWALGEDANLTI